MKTRVYVTVAALLAAWGLWAVGAEPAKEGPAASKPAQPDLSSPKSVIAGVHAALAAGDAELAAGYFEPAWQQYMRRMVKGAATLASATEKVLAAAKAKWTTDEAEKLAKAPLFGMKLADMGGLGAGIKDGQIDWSKIKIEEKDNTATVTVDGGAAMKQVKANGKWHLAVPSSVTVATSDVELALKQQEAQLPLVIRAYEAVAAGIADGTVKPDNIGWKFTLFLGSGASAPGTEKPPAQPETQPATAPVKVDLSSPESLAGTLRAAEAARDRSAVEQCVTPAKRKDFARVMVLDARVEAMQAGAIAAIRQKFPKETATYVLAGNLFNKVMPDTLAPTAALAHAGTSERLTVKQEDDKGEILTGVAYKWPIAKTDGKWYVDPPLPANFDEEIKLAEQDFKVFEGFYRDVAKGVKDGTLTPQTWATETMRLLAKHSKENE